MILGILSGIFGCALWGFLYLVPVLLPSYDPISIAMARFTFFGAGSLVLVPFYRKELAGLTRKDWYSAFKLAFIGNAVYYVFLTQGIKFAGAPLAGMLMALIPLLVALISNRPSAENAVVVPWSRLIFPLLLIVAGLIWANVPEFDLITKNADSWQYWIGAACSSAAVLLWTWFPIQNARWQFRHPQVSPFAWTTAQGLVILPATVLCFLFMQVNDVLQGGVFLGNHASLFILVTLGAGVVSGWGGMAFWNYMSAKLPVSLSGQMITFETIFAVTYTLIYRKQWPDPSLLAGLVILLIGVAWSMKLFRDAMEEKKKNSSLS